MMSEVSEVSKVAKSRNLNIEVSVTSVRRSETSTLLGPICAQKPRQRSFLFQQCQEMQRIWKSIHMYIMYIYICIYDMQIGIFMEQVIQTVSNVGRQESIYHIL